MAKAFVAQAVGDLDCDGTCTHELTGSVSGSVLRVQLTEPPPNAE